ncbi:MAG: YfhD family protein [Bacillus sp. (in: firmicutes)]
MNRANKAKKTDTLPQSDGLDVEFSIDQADADDMEALERSRAADERAHQRENK